MGIRRQEDRLEAYPIYFFSFVPRCIVADDQIPLPLKIHVLVGVIQESLEYLGIAMSKFQGIKIT